MEETEPFNYSCVYASQNDKPIKDIDHITDEELMDFYECCDIDFHGEFIDASAFVSDNEITALMTPPDLREIYPGAFSNMTSLKYFIMNGLVKNLRPKTFSGCSALERILLTDTLEEIDDMVFLNCSSLKKDHHP